MQFDGIFLFLICLPYFQLAVFSFPLTVGERTFHICVELNSWKHINSFPFISQMNLSAESISLTREGKNIHSIYFGISSTQYIFFNHESVNTVLWETDIIVQG